MYIYIYIYIYFFFFFLIICKLCSLSLSLENIELNSLFDTFCEASNAGLSFSLVLQYTQQLTFL